MKLVAIDPTTGKILMSQEGTMSEDAFRKMLAMSFPNVAGKDILIISDGEAHSVNQGSRPHSMRFEPNSVIFKGSFKDCGGYANMNREICLRLMQHGFAVKIDMLNTPSQVDPTTLGLLNTLASVKLKNEAHCPLVVGFTPMPVSNRGRKVVFYTMMETQGLHPEFVDRCNKFPNEIWVPCKFCADMFKKNGVVKPIRIMPLGVNHHIYTPNAVEPTLRYEEMSSGRIVDSLPDGFRFMSLFGWSYRKGPDVLCRSFLREFSGMDDCILVIYSRYAGGSGEAQKDHVRKEIASYYAEVSSKTPPRIYYCGDAIPIGDMPGIYAAADCFVFCSRGEGFGLPVIEAGACEVPVISAYNTAMTHYLDEEVAFLVETDEYAPANEKLTWISNFYRDQDFPVLGAGVVAEFSRLMRSVYDDPKTSKEKAGRFRERILQEYTWDACTERVVAGLKMLGR